MIAGRLRLLGMAGWVLVFGAALGGAPAQAQLWGYVDGQGVAHFSLTPQDSRYSPVLRGPLEEPTRFVPGKSMQARNLLTWLEFAPEVKALQPVLREAERKTGVDTELLKAMIAVESGFRSDLVSPRGAVGLMQITPDTGLRYATRAEASAGPIETRLREPRLNVLVGARMLADLFSRHGDVSIALAAWNAGEGSVGRAGGKMPPFPETRSHVHLVLELYWALLQQRHQGRAQSLLMVPPTPAASGPSPVSR